MTGKIKTFKQTDLQKEIKVHFDYTEVRGIVERALLKPKEMNYKIFTKEEWLRLIKK